MFIIDILRDLVYLCDLGQFSIQNKLGKGKVSWARCIPNIPQFSTRLNEFPPFFGGLPGCFCHRLDLQGNSGDLFTFWYLRIHLAKEFWSTSFVNPCHVLEVPKKLPLLYFIYINILWVDMHYIYIYTYIKTTYIYRGEYWYINIYRLYITYIHYYVDIHYR